jgi:hypothetical protein
MMRTPKGREVTNSYKEERHQDVEFSRSVADMISVEREAHNAAVEFDDFLGQLGREIDNLMQESPTEEEVSNIKRSDTCGPWRI